jgi:hypothetical protein
MVAEQSGIQATHMTLVQDLVVLKNQLNAAAKLERNEGGSPLDLKNAALNVLSSTTRSIGGISFYNQHSLIMPDEQDEAEGTLLFGVAAVKDLNGNQHFLASSPNRTREVHTEEHLKNSIVSHYKDRKLNAAKVLFYMHSSPCKQCTKNIPKWVNEIRSAVTGRRKSTFFVFNFLDYYTANQTQSMQGSKNTWTDDGEAEKAYRKLEAQAGMTWSFGHKPVYGSDDQFSQYLQAPVLTFRKGEWNRRAGTADFQKFTRVKNEIGMLVVRKMT